MCELVAVIQIDLVSMNGKQIMGEGLSVGPLLCDLWVKLKFSPVSWAPPRAPSGHLSCSACILKIRL